MKEQFIQMIKPLIETNDSCLFSLAQSTARVIKNSGEEDFLNEMVGKYLVVNRLGRKCLYGKIEKVNTRISIDSEKLKFKYTIEVIYQNRKDPKKFSYMYINLLNCDFEIFDTEKEAENYIK